MDISDDILIGVYGTLDTPDPKLWDLPELDFDWIEGAKTLAARLDADQAVRDITFHDLVKSVLGEGPVLEPIIQKVYSSELTKSVFGGSIPVFASAATLTVDTAGIAPKRPSASQRRKALREIIQAAGITVNDTNANIIEDLISSMQVYIDNVKLAGRG
jgi:hypothetical protein